MLLNNFDVSSENWGEDEEDEEENDMEDEQEVPVKKVKAPGEKKVRKEHLNVVFIGHVGKCHNILHLIYDVVIVLNILCAYLHIIELVYLGLFYLLLKC